MQTDDEQLVSRTLAGDKDAFAELVERYRDAVCAVAYSYLGNFDDVQDAAQDAFLQVYRQLAQLREPGKFGPWLRRITSNVCLGMLRRKGHNLLPLDILSEHSDTSSSKDLAQSLAVRDALSRLSENARVTLTLFHMDGYSHAEIAGFLEVPVNTVRSRLRSARKQLSEEMIDMVTNELSEGKKKVRIANMDNLKSALVSPDKVNAIRSIDTWLPVLAQDLDWSCRITEHFIINYHQDPEVESILDNSFLDSIENIYCELSALLPLEPRTNQGKSLMNSRTVFFIAHTRSKRTFGTVIDPNTLFYLLDTVQDPEYLRRFRHEIAHILWIKLYGEAPALLNEGIAVYAEHMSVPGCNFESFLNHDQLIMENIPPLAEIILSDEFEKRGPYYGVGGLFVHYLIERWGWESLCRLFMKTDYRDSDIALHFAEVYGESIHDIETDWRKYLEQRMNR